MTRWNVHRVKDPDHLGEVLQVKERMKRKGEQGKNKLGISIERTAYPFNFILLKRWITEEPVLNAESNSLHEVTEEQNNSVLIDALTFINGEFGIENQKK